MLRYWKRKEKISNDLELIYEWKGHRYYAFKNAIESLPTKRAVMAELKAREADMIMDKQMLIDYVNAATDYLNKGKISEVAITLNEIKIRTSLVTEESLLLNLAACYVLKEGEDVYNVDFSKVDEWKQDDAMLSFFLSMARQLIAKFSDISQADLENYLRESKIMIEKLNRYTNMFKNNDTK